MAKRKKTVPRRPKPPPICKAILLCEKAIIEHLTGNVSLINTFTGFVLKDFPGHINQFMVFLQLTGASGRYEITAQLHDLREDKIIARSSSILIEFAGKLDRANVIIPVPSLRLNHDGAYDLVVLANNQQIDKQQFTASKRPGQDSPEESTEDEHDDKN